jgi:NAD(P)-dependent dehydrogenase (short-subunit alcohol dehydrogenase family)
MEDFADKVVLVTGGTSGFGRAIASTFLEQRAQVIITSSHESSLSDTGASLLRADRFCADAGNPTDWEALEEHVRERYGRLDFLINNAGGGVAVMDAIEQSIESIEAILRLNLQSVIYGCRVFGKMMKMQRGGTIVNISSSCANHSWPGFSIYAAAKAGVVSFSKSLYVELRPYDVRVTALVPGAARTGFSKKAGLPEPRSPFRLEAKHISEAVLHICGLPSGVWVEQYRIWGTDQEVIPI